MLLTEKEKEVMMNIAKRKKRTKKEKWLAKYFGGIQDGWCEKEDVEM